MKKKRTVAAIILLCLPLFFIIYVSNCYRADDYAMTFMSDTDKVSVRYFESDDICFQSENAKTGFIFYPGGKVEKEAYAPVMKQLAENGILCVIADMPFNLAVFNPNAAEDTVSKFQNIERWYIGGHSLGGSMAAMHLSSNPETYSGLILLASYSTADLSDADIDVLSVRASEDKILNMENYNKYLLNLPRDATEEVIIQGGCHGFFGSYGMQKNDGTPQITAAEQLDLTAEYINDFIK